MDLKPFVKHSHPPTSVVAPVAVGSSSVSQPETAACIVPAQLAAACAAVMGDSLYIVSRFKKQITSDLETFSPLVWILSRFREWSKQLYSFPKLAK